MTRDDLFKVNPPNGSSSNNSVLVGTRQPTACRGLSTINGWAAAIAVLLQPIAAGMKLWMLRCRLVIDGHSWMCYRGCADQCGHCQGPGGGMRQALPWGKRRRVVAGRVQPALAACGCMYIVSSVYCLGHQFEFNAVAAAVQCCVQQPAPCELGASCVQLWAIRVSPQHNREALSPLLLQLTCGHQLYVCFAQDAHNWCPEIDCKAELLTIRQQQPAGALLSLLASPPFHSVSRLPMKPRLHRSYVCMYGCRVADHYG